MTRDAQLILFAGALLAAAVAASMVAARLRLPALVLFLGLGMAVGSDGLGWIYFDDYQLARLVGTIALAFILFEGGLATGLRRLRPVAGPAVALASIGTVLTALIAGLAAAALLNLSLTEGLLLGAIHSPTDGAAVFALLRGVRLPERLALTLEGEAGLNDPIAVMLVLVMIAAIRDPGYGVLDGAWFLVHEVVVGAGGLLVFPSQLGAVFLRGTALALVVALVARPLAALGATAGSAMARRERILVGWAGLRGGVPVVLATLPVIDHVPGSLEFFNLVFFAVLVSTVLQGTSVEWLAGRLGLSSASRAAASGAPS